jgi:hypothetical protein
LSDGDGSNAGRLVVGIVIGLAVLLAFASGGAPLWSPRGVRGLDRTSIVAAVVVLFSLGLLVTAALAAVLHRRALERAGDTEAPTLRAVFVRLMPVTLVGWALASLYGIAEGHLGRPPDPLEPGQPYEPSAIGEALRFIGGWDVPVVTGPGAQPFGPDLSQPIATPPLGLIVGLVLVSALAALRVWRRRDRSDSDASLEGDDTPARIDAVATRKAVVASFEAMLGDPDPKTAIIGAYAHLLDGLSKAGAPRAAHEGPSEHLRRVLETVRVRPEPIRRLVSLFETARFSRHLLTSGHRDQALAAFEAVAADLLDDPTRPRSLETGASR